MDRRLDILKEAWSESLTDQRNQVVRDFYAFAKKRLGFKSTPKIKLVSKRSSDMTTANVNPVTNVMKILTTHGTERRALVDILRSIAHELVHIKQTEIGQEEQFNTGPDHLRDVGSPNEDEANAKAGALVKEFSRTYSHPELNQNTIYEL